MLWHDTGPCPGFEKVAQVVAEPAMPDPGDRVDERDTMFARMALEAHSLQHQAYYSRRPELRAEDDRIRELPGLLEPGATFYDPDVALQTREFFQSIGEIEVDASLVEEWAERLRSAKQPTSELKQMLLRLGAVAAGCAALDQKYVYTHKGRFPEESGDRIALDHPSVVLFLVEMDFDEMRRAPKAEVIRESARQYYRAARISMVLEKVLRSAGHAAKAHFDAHYDLILPPLAVLAGLGELGRNNILIADRYGSRVRIGAVSTDFPSVPDKPVSLGADALCEVCMKCAENCPSRSLSLTDKEMVRGVKKWPTRVESCYAYWRTVGTDCGVCMASCPFSHKNNAFHNLVRRFIKQFRWLRRPAVFFENLCYGRKWRPR